MKTLIALFMSTLIGSFGLTSLSYAAGSKLVEGDILNIEGEFYTVRDKSGHDVRLHVGKTTHLEGGIFKVGDKIEAHVTNKGHARSLIHLSATGQTETPGSKIIEGDILKIEGEYYTVHDRSGHEVRLHVGKKSHLDDTFRVGDKVEAYATGKGHVRAMYHLEEFQPTS